MYKALRHPCINTDEIVLHKAVFPSPSIHPNISQQRPNQ
nr:MAG TPA: hypothetical protein [Caudoviricetes sp.]